MNMRILVCCIVLISSSLVCAPKKLIFVDGIKAVFRGSDGVDLIMHSEVNRLKLDGTSTTLPDLITDLALGQEAKKYRLWPSPEEVDKQRRMLCESNKKTPKEFDELLLTIGYTPEEGWHTFAQINAINSLVGYKITGNLIVPESEVEAYYNENPEYQEASYQLQYVVVPFRQSGSKEKQLQQLKALALAGDQKNTLNWGEPFWIKENEVASDKQFITDLAVGAVSEPVSTSEGFELFRLKSKKNHAL